MAEPTLVHNSATGTDSLASGAGPETAITVTDGSTSLDGLTVTLPNADLSAVLTDGSHAVYIQGRGWGKITGKADSGLATANVTVSVAFTGSLASLTVAIGGKRASVFGGSKTELENTIQVGWTLYFEAGHSESYTGGDYFTLSFPTPTQASDAIKFHGPETGAKPFFENIITNFRDNFDFTGARYLDIRNCSFRAERTGSEVNSCLKLAYNTKLINCRLVANKLYSLNGVVNTAANAGCTVENCDITCEDGDGSGIAGRGVTAIQNRIWNVEQGIRTQPYPYNAVIEDNEIQASIVDIEFYGGFSRAVTIQGNIGIAPTFFIDTTKSLGNSDAVSLVRRNISTGTTAFISSTEGNQEHWVVRDNNHPAAASNSVDGSMVLGTNNEDPQLTGDPSTGGYTIGNATVAALVGRGSASSGGTSAAKHPLVHR